MGDTIENITFSNIDILEHDEDDRNYQGCLAITATDKNLIRNITYDNIRVENIQEGMLFNFRVMYNEKYSAAPGRSIENIRVNELTYSGDPVNPSVVQGYDANRMVKNLIFKKVKVNGTVLERNTPRGVRIGDFTQDIQIK